MGGERRSQRLQPKLISFDVFGTLVSVRDSSYGAFERILDDAGANGVDVKAFWERWEHRNRREIALDSAVPPPDFILPDIQSLSGLIEL